MITIEHTLDKFIMVFIQGAGNGNKVSPVREATTSLIKVNPMTKTDVQTEGGHCRLDSIYVCMYVCQFKL